MSSSGSGSSDDDSSDSSAEWTGNEGESTEQDEETPAHQTMRGQAGLVTASCPRKYPRDVAMRVKLGKRVPDDFTTAELLKKFRRTVNANSNVMIETWCQ